jgi:hypothetical protein
MAEGERKLANVINAVRSEIRSMALKQETHEKVKYLIMYFKH